MHDRAEAGRPADWYSVLGVSRSATTQEIAALVERMSRQANALSITAPERARQLRDQVRAIKQDLLSGDDQRQRYDQREAGQPGPDDVSPQWPAFAGQHVGPHADQERAAGGAGMPGFMSRVTRFLQAGWTCTGCGYGALPTDKFCPKCGAPIQPGLQRRAADEPPAARVPPAGAPAHPPLTCGRCGAGLAADNAFCIRCGAQRS